MKKTLYLGLMLLFTMTINVNAKDYLTEFVEAHPDLNSSKMIALLSEGKNEANAS